MKLIDKVLEGLNIEAAYKQVVSNKGSAGVDGVGVRELKVYLQINWTRIKQEILTGRYFPQAVKGVSS